MALTRQVYDIPPSKVRSAILASLMFFAVFYVQALIVKQYATNVPYLDEWDETRFFTHLFNGSMSLSQLAAQHNEHRILMARLAFAVLSVLAHEWNVIIFMLFSAVLAGLIAGLWSYALSRMGAQTWIIVISALILASPVQIENMIWGFQVQFYMVSLFTVGGVIAVSLLGRLGWSAVAVGALAAFAATFSIASGVMAWVAVGLTLVLLGLTDSGSLGKLVRNKEAVMRLAVFAGSGVITLVLFFYGYQFGTPDEIRGQSVAEIVNWAARALSFPVINDFDASFLPIVIALAFLWTPIIAVMIALKRWRSETKARQMLALFTGISAFLVSNAATIAFGRAHLLVIASRYGTIFLWSSVLSLLAMSMLVPAVRNLAKPNSKRLATAGIAIAITLLVYVNYARGLQALVDAGNRQRDREWMKASVKAFLREPQARLSGSIPYPDVRRFLTFLTDANVQKILPPEIRQPALSSSWSATGDAWTPNGTHTPTNPEASWGSWSGSDAHTGRIESPTFTVIEPYLKIPISGYPALPGNELAIETTGGPTARIVYTGGNPGERWNTWTPDVSSIASRNVRIIGMDNNTTLQSWFGIGQPQAATRTQITIDGFMSYLDYVAGIAIIGAVVALGLPIVAERHEVHPPPPETPAPGETKRRRSKA